MSFDLQSNTAGGGCATSLQMIIGTLSPAGDSLAGGRACGYGAFALYRKGASVHFLNPNYHVILIHYPLGVFMLGLTIELLGFLWPTSSVRSAARWMILLGGLATLPAATSGIYALSDAASGPHWTEHGKHMLRMHTWLQGIATLLATFTAVFALAASDGWRRRFHLIALGIFAVCGGLMVVGSWYGGESVYTQGVSVSEEPESVAPDTTKRDIEGTITFYAGEPIQMHMIGAGVMFAFAMAALGLSIRKITVEYPDSVHFPLMSDTSADSMEDAPLMGVHEAGDSPQPHFARPGDLPEEHFVPAGRFWLLAALLGLLTAAGGYWVWADGSEHWAFQHFWNDVMSTKGRLNTDREAIHVWLGVSLIVLPLVLASLARWAPRQRAVLSVFAILLMLVISAQVFLGVLLRFDGASGPIYRFSPADKSSASVMPAQSRSTFSRSSV